MAKFGNAIDKICAVISGTCLTGLIAVNFADSIGRQIGNPVIGAQEIGSFLLCIFFFSSLPILVRENGHIRVGLVTELYGQFLKRVERIWSFLFELGATGLLLYLLYDFAGRQARIGQVSAHFQFKVAPFIYIAAALTLLAVIFVIERKFWHLPDHRSEAEKDAHHLKGDNT